MTTFQDFAQSYLAELERATSVLDLAQLEKIIEAIKRAYHEKKRIFVMGNGGSAANAMHIANDLIYGVPAPDGVGIRVNALPANSAVLTCLANDTGFDRVFATQLAVLANPGDLLIVLSGSGNSPNILAALEEARRRGAKSYAVLGYSGGKAKALADVAIHFPIDDMQISEDLQLVVGHMLMRWLCSRKDSLTED